MPTPTLSLSHRRGPNLEERHTAKGGEPREGTRLWVALSVRGPWTPSRPAAAAHISGTEPGALPLASGLFLLSDSWV